MKKVEVFLIKCSIELIFGITNEGMKKIFFWQLAQVNARKHTQKNLVLIEIDDRKLRKSTYCTSYYMESPIMRCFEMKLAVILKLKLAVLLIKTGDEFREYNCIL